MATQSIKFSPLLSDMSPDAYFLPTFRVAISFSEGTRSFNDLREGTEMVEDLSRDLANSF